MGRVERSKVKSLGKKKSPHAPLADAENQGRSERLCKTLARTERRRGRGERFLRTRVAQEKSKVNIRKSTRSHFDAQCKQEPTPSSNQLNFTRRQSDCLRPLRPEQALPRNL